MPNLHRHRRQLFFDIESLAAFQYLPRRMHTFDDSPGSRWTPTTTPTVGTYYTAYLLHVLRINERRENESPTSVRDT